MNSLYKLDQYSNNGMIGEISDELPKESAVLLTSLCTVWIALAIYYTVHTINKKKKQ